MCSVWESLFVALEMAEWKFFNYSTDFFLQQIEKWWILHLLFFHYYFACNCAVDAVTSCDIETFSFRMWVEIFLDIGKKFPKKKTISLFRLLNLRGEGKVSFAAKRIRSWVVVERVYTRQCWCRSCAEFHAFTLFFLRLVSPLLTVLYLVFLLYHVYCLTNSWSLPLKLSIPSRRWARGEDDELKSQNPSMIYLRNENSRKWKKNNKLWYFWATIKRFLTHSEHDTTVIMLAGDEKKKIFFWSKK